MATYSQLDINQKINVKAAIQAWLTYSVQHFQVEIDKKVYGQLGTRITKKGIQSSKLSRNYRFGRGAKRTFQLRKAWWQNLSSTGEHAQIGFMLYGRFLDMGVGKGTSHTDRLVSRSLRLGGAGRKRKPWYSKRKSYEIKRLREILAEKNIHLAMDTVETALTISVQANLKF